MQGFLEGNWKDLDVLFADLADNSNSAVMDVSFGIGGVQISGSLGDSAMAWTLSAKIW